MENVEDDSAACQTGLKKVTKILTDDFPRSQFSDSLAKQAAE